jgi:hypothetical protein
MASVYDNVNQVDCWIGGLCEPQLRGAMVGPMNLKILVDQFSRLRDGDRFWYQNYLPPELVRLVEGQSLADLIRRNTEIGEELPDNVFLAEDAADLPPTREGTTRNSIPTSGRESQPSKREPTRRSKRQ